MTAETKVSLRVTHWFAATAERVFDAWLDPATAGKWLFATATGTMTRVEIDARVGGRFLITRRDGEEVDHVGEYLEIARPHRLVFTFAVPKFSPEFTRVSLDIATEGKGCRLTLTHDGVLAEWARRVEEGWGTILAALGQRLAIALDGAEAVTGTADNAGLGFSRVSRRFAAAPERVFDAWLDPRLAGRWLFTTPTSEANSTEIDGRVGGKWKIIDRRNGKDYTAIGEYREIDRPRRLVFTFGMPQFSPEFGRVSVEIVADGSGSVLTVLHERLPSAQLRETDKGWAEMFARLAAIIEP